MAFWVRKVFGAFEKRAPGKWKKEDPGNGAVLSRVQDKMVTGYLLHGQVQQ